MTEARPEPLEIAWRNASNSEAAAAVFLHELSGHYVWTVLRQPPGFGDAAPEYNLMQLKRNADGEVFVPIFTHPTHVTISIPSPAQLARCPCGTSWLPGVTNVTLSTRCPSHRSNCMRLA